jgi:hypothetical protein
MRSRSAALVECHDRQAAPNQLRDEIRLQIRERQDQIGLERDDLVELRVDERRDLGLLPRFRRAHGVTRHADDAVALSQEIERFCRFLGQADDATGESGHLVI